MIAGVEAEREVETEYELEGGELEEKSKSKTIVTPQIELEFAIPIFDSGKARQRKAEYAYMQAANKLAEKAVNIRSEARSLTLPSNPHTRSPATIAMRCCLCARRSRKKVC